MTKKRFNKDEPKYAGWYCMKDDMVIYNASQNDINEHMATHKRNSSPDIKNMKHSKSCKPNVNELLKSTNSVEWEAKFDNQFIPDGYEGIQGFDPDEIKDFIRTLIKDIFSQLPSQYDPMGRKEMLEKIEELRILLTK